MYSENAGLYAIAGALVMSCGMISFGLMHSPAPATAVDDATNKTTVSVSDAASPSTRDKDADTHRSSGSMSHGTTTTAPSDRHDAKTSEDSSSDQAQERIRKIGRISDDQLPDGKEEHKEEDAADGQARTITVPHQDSMKALDSQQSEAISGIIKQACGDKVPVALRAATYDWDGGKGKRLVVTAYAEESSFSSGEELAKAFAKMTADLTNAVKKQMGEVEILSVALYGMEGAAKAQSLPTYPEASGLEWAALASVSTQSIEHGAIGDINKVSVTYGEKAFPVDMPSQGFSRIPPQE